MILKIIVLLISIFFLSFKVFAYCEVDISNYVGWQIIYSGTVTGYITEDGTEESSFEGCEYGRVLIVDYTQQVTCSEYSYSYSFQPDIVVLSNGQSLEACIDGDMYSIY